MMDAKTLFAIAEPYIIERLLQNGAPLTGKSKAGFGCLITALICACAGAGFLVYALYQWLLFNFTPDIAAALTGAALMFLSALSILTAWGLLKYQKMKSRALQRQMSETVEELIELANGELAEPVRDHPKAALLIASCAGLIAGHKLL
jgi:hypothetical protein